MGVLGPKTPGRHGAGVGAQGEHLSSGLALQGTPVFRSGEGARTGAAHGFCLSWDRTAGSLGSMALLGSIRQAQTQAASGPASRRGDRYWGTKSLSAGASGVSPQGCESRPFFGNCTSLGFFLP